MSTPFCESGTCDLSGTSHLKSDHSNPFDRFAVHHGIWVDAKRTSSNPHMDDAAGMTHWACTIHGSGGRTMEVVYSMGAAFDRPPTTAEVLETLAMDAFSVEDAASFEVWADDHGYDTDSRKAEATYRAVKEQTEGLRYLLGDEAFAKLMEVEAS